MEIFDLSPWIQSSEIREYLTKTWTPSTEEQEQLVLHSHRPLDEKIRMLWNLQKWADSAGERSQLRQMHRFFKFARKQIIMDIPGCQYLWKSMKKIREPVCEFEGYDGYDHAGLVDSYEVLLNTIEAKGTLTAKYLSTLSEEESKKMLNEWNPAYDIVKYIPTSDGLQPLIHFTLEWIDGQFSPTRFSFCGELAQADFEGDDLEQFKTAQSRYGERCVPACPLPFVTGNLVYIKPPFLSGPIVGIFGRELEDYDSLLYIHGNRFCRLDISNGFLGSTSYRVVDWVHSAASSQLPYGHGILNELSQYLLSLPSETINERFTNILDRLLGLYFDVPSCNPYHVTPVTLDELLREH